MVTDGHTILYIKSDGSLWGIGKNDYGQLGDGTTEDRHIPVMIEGTGVIAIAEGAAYTQWR